MGKRTIYISLWDRTEVKIVFLRRRNSFSPVVFSVHSYRFNTIGASTLDLSQKTKK